MADDNASQKKLLTLTPEEITEVAPVGRRSALGAIGALVGAAVGVVLLKPEDSEACRRRTGRTDSDGGPNADGVNRGHTGITDQDSGDEAQCGRGRARRRCTDSDSGPGADGVNHGRHC